MSEIEEIAEVMRDGFASWLAEGNIHRNEAAARLYVAEDKILSAGASRSMIEAIAAELCKA